MVSALKSYLRFSVTKNNPAAIYKCARHQTITKTLFSITDLSRITTMWVPNGRRSRRGRPRTRWKDDLPSFHKNWQAIELRIEIYGREKGRLLPSSGAIYTLPLRFHQDLPMPSYICSLLKSTTRTERVSCAAAMTALVVCVTLVVYFSLQRHNVPIPDDVAPHEWNITRKMWLARDYNYTSFNHQYEPLKLVIVQHTVGGECNTFTNCAAELRNLQNYFINYKGYDIPYNFLIGNDGRVYEGRGWSVEGAHTFGFNKCTIGLGFIGDYRQTAGTQHTKVTQAQLERTLMLLDESIRLGYLHKDYFIVGAKDLQDSESPGENLYNELKKWEHYDHKNRFYKKSCAEIEEIFANMR